MKLALLLLLLIRLGVELPGVLKRWELERGSIEEACPKPWVWWCECWWPCPLSALMLILEEDAGLKLAADRDILIGRVKGDFEKLPDK